jgi:hypothetical protein
MDEAERVALLAKLNEARASLRSKGGPHTLKFMTYTDEGWIVASNKRVVECLCALWNAAPALLAQPIPESQL